MLRIIVPAHEKSFRVFLDPYSSSVGALKSGIRYGPVPLPEEGEISLFSDESGTKELGIDDRCLASYGVQDGDILFVRYSEEAALSRPDEKLPPSSAAILSSQETEPTIVEVWCPPVPTSRPESLPFEDTPLLRGSRKLSLLVSGVACSLLEEDLPSQLKSQFRGILTTSDAPIAVTGNPFEWAKSSDLTPFAASDETQKPEPRLCGVPLPHDDVRVMESMFRLGYHDLVPTVEAQAQASRARNSLFLFLRESVLLGTSASSPWYTTKLLPRTKQLWEAIANAGAAICEDAAAALPEKGGSSGGSTASFPLPQPAARSTSLPAESPENAQKLLQCLAQMSAGGVTRATASAPQSFKGLPYSTPPTTSAEMVSELTSSQGIFAFLVALRFSPSARAHFATVMQGLRNFSTPTFKDRAVCRQYPVCVELSTVDRLRLLTTAIAAATFLAIQESEQGWDTLAEPTSWAEEGSISSWSDLLWGVLDSTIKSLEVAEDPRGSVDDGFLRENARFAARLRQWLVLVALGAVNVHPSQSGLALCDGEFGNKYYRSKLSNAEANQAVSTPLRASDTGAKQAAESSYRQVSGHWDSPALLPPPRINASLIRSMVAAFNDSAASEAATCDLVWAAARFTEALYLARRSQTNTCSDAEVELLHSWSRLPLFSQGWSGCTPTDIWELIGRGANTFQLTPCSEVESHASRSVPFPFGPVVEEFLSSLDAEDTALANAYSWIRTSEPEPAGQVKRGGKGMQLFMKVLFASLIHAANAEAAVSSIDTSAEPGTASNVHGGAQVLSAIWQAVLEGKKSVLAQVAERVKQLTDEQAASLQAGGASSVRGHMLRIVLSEAIGRCLVVLGWTMGTKDEFTEGKSEMGEGDDAPARPSLLRQLSTPALEDRSGATSVATLWSKLRSSEPFGGGENPTETVYTHLLRPCLEVILSGPQIGPFVEYLVQHRRVAESRCEAFSALARATRAGSERGDATFTECVAAVALAWRFMMFGSRNVQRSDILVPNDSPIPFEAYPDGSIKPPYLRFDKQHLDPGLFRWSDSLASVDVTIRSQLSNEANEVVKFLAEELMVRHRRATPPTSDAADPMRAVDSALCRLIFGCLLYTWKPSDVALLESQGLFSFLSTIGLEQTEDLHHRTSLSFIAASMAQVVSALSHEAEEFNKCESIAASLNSRPAAASPLVVSHPTLRRAGSFVEDEQSSASPLTAPELSPLAPATLTGLLQRVQADLGALVEMYRPRRARVVAPRQFERWRKGERTLLPTEYLVMRLATLSASKYWIASLLDVSQLEGLLSTLWSIVAFCPPAPVRSASEVIMALLQSFRRGNERHHALLGRCVTTALCFMREENDGQPLTELSGDFSEWKPFIACDEAIAVRPSTSSVAVKVIRSLLSSLQQSSRDTWAELVVNSVISKALCAAQSEAGTSKELWRLLYPVARICAIDDEPLLEGALVVQSNQASGSGICMRLVRAPVHQDSLGEPLLRATLGDIVPAGEQLRSDGTGFRDQEANSGLVILGNATPIPIPVPLQHLRPVAGIRPTLPLSFAPSVLGSVAALAWQASHHASPYWRAAWKTGVKGSLRKMVDTDNTLSAPFYSALATATNLTGPKSVLSSSGVYTYSMTSTAGAGSKGAFGSSGYGSSYGNYSYGSYTAGGGAYPSYVASSNPPANSGYGYDAETEEALQVELALAASKASATEASESDLPAGQEEKQDELCQESKEEPTISVEFKEVVQQQLLTSLVDTPFMEGDASTDLDSIRQSSRGSWAVLHALGTLDASLRSPVHVNAALEALQQSVWHDQLQGLQSHPGFKHNPGLSVLSWLMLLANSPVQCDGSAITIAEGIKGLEHSLQGQNIDAEHLWAAATKLRGLLTTVEHQGKELSGGNIVLSDVQSQCSFPTAEDPEFRCWNVDGEEEPEIVVEENKEDELTEDEKVMMGLSDEQVVGVMNVMETNCVPAKVAKYALQQNGWDPSASVMWLFEQGQSPEELLERVEKAEAQRREQEEKLKLAQQNAQKQQGKTAAKTNAQSSLPTSPTDPGWKWSEEISGEDVGSSVAQSIEACKEAMNELLSLHRSGDGSPPTSAAISKAIEQLGRGAAKGLIAEMRATAELVVYWARRIMYQLLLLAPTHSGTCKALAAAGQEAQLLQVAELVSDASAQSLKPSEPHPLPVMSSLNAPWWPLFPGRLRFSLVLPDGKSKYSLKQVQTSAAPSTPAAESRGASETETKTEEVLSIPETYLPIADAIPMRVLEGVVPISLYGQTLLASLARRALTQIEKDSPLRQCLEQLATSKTPPGESIVHSCLWVGGTHWSVDPIARLVYTAATQPNGGWLGILGPYFRAAYSPAALANGLVAVAASRGSTSCLNLLAHAVAQSTVGHSIATELGSSPSIHTEPSRKVTKQEGSEALIEETDAIAGPFPLPASASFDFFPEMAHWHAYEANTCRESVLIWAKVAEGCLERLSLDDITNNGWALCQESTKDWAPLVLPTSLSSFTACVIGISYRARLLFERNLSGLFNLRPFDDDLRPLALLTILRAATTAVHHCLEVQAAPAMEVSSPLVDVAATLLAGLPQKEVETWFFTACQDYGLVEKPRVMRAMLDVMAVSGALLGLLRQVCPEEALESLLQQRRNALADLFSKTKDQYINVSSVMLPAPTGDGATLGVTNFPNNLFGLIVTPLKRVITWNAPPPPAAAPSPPASGGPAPGGKKSKKGKSGKQPQHAASQPATTTSSPASSYYYGSYGSSNTGSASTSGGFSSSSGGSAPSKAAGSSEKSPKNAAPPTPGTITVVHGDGAQTVVSIPDTDAATSSSFGKVYTHSTKRLIAQALNLTGPSGAPLTQAEAVATLMVKKLASLPGTAAARRTAVKEFANEGSSGDEWAMNRTLASAGIGNCSIVVIHCTTLSTVYRLPFTFSSARAGKNCVVSSKGTEVRHSGGGHACAIGTAELHHGVHYWEVHVLETEPNAGHMAIGIVDSSRGTHHLDALHRSTGGDTMGISLCSWRGFYSYKEGPAYGNHFGPGDIIGVRVDCDSRLLSFTINGEDLGIATGEIVPPVRPLIGFTGGSPGKVALRGAQYSSSICLPLALRISAPKEENTDSKEEMAAESKRPEEKHAQCLIAAASHAQGQPSEGIDQAPGHLVPRFSRIMDTTAFLSLPPPVVYRCASDCFAYVSTRVPAKLNNSAAQRWMAVARDIAAAKGSESWSSQAQALLGPLKPFLQRAYDRFQIWIEGRYRLLPTAVGTSLWVDERPASCAPFRLKPGDSFSETRRVVFNLVPKMVTTHYHVVGVAKSRACCGYNSAWLPVTGSAAASGKAVQQSDDTDDATMSNWLLTGGDEPVTVQNEFATPDSDPAAAAAAAATRPEAAKRRAKGKQRKTAGRESASETTLLVFQKLARKHAIDRSHQSSDGAGAGAGAGEEKKDESKEEQSSGTPTKELKGTGAVHALSLGEWKQGVSSGEIEVYTNTSAETQEEGERWRGLTPECFRACTDAAASSGGVSFEAFVASFCSWNAALAECGAAAVNADDELAATLNRAAQSAGLHTLALAPFQVYEHLSGKQGDLNVPGQQLPGVARTAWGNVQEALGKGSLDSPFLPLLMRVAVLNEVNETVRPLLPYATKEWVEQYLQLAPSWKHRLTPQPKEPLHLSSGSLHDAITLLQHTIYTAVKRQVWEEAMAYTDTPVSAPPDPFQPCSSIGNLRVNRKRAREALVAPDSMAHASTLLGQVSNYFGSKRWHYLRRSWAAASSGWQRRNFYLKLYGEGSNDQGGPYRALFSNVVEELAVAGSLYSRILHAGASALDPKFPPPLLPTPASRGSSHDASHTYGFNPDPVAGMWGNEYQWSAAAAITGADSFDTSVGHCVDAEEWGGAPTTPQPFSYAYPVLPQRGGGSYLASSYSYPGKAYGYGSSSTANAGRKQRPVRPFIAPPGIPLSAGYGATTTSHASYPTMSAWEAEGRKLSYDAYGSSTSYGGLPLASFRILGRFIGVSHRSRIFLPLDLAPRDWDRLRAVGETGQRQGSSICGIPEQLVFHCPMMINAGELGRAMAAHSATSSAALAAGAAAANVHDMGARLLAGVQKLHSEQGGSAAGSIAGLGLSEVLPVHHASYWTTDEWIELIAGRRVPDFSVLRCVATVEPAGDDPSDTRVASWLWDILDDLSLDDQEAFVSFISAHSRLPTSPQEFALPFTIEIERMRKDQEETDRQLPHSSTCFFTLRLPRYSSPSILKSRLTTAVRMCTEMDADERTTEVWDV